MSTYYLRDVIGNYLEHLGEISEKVVLVTADLMGTCRTRSFATKFPQRYFNVGIAEQNMVSFSAGLAHEGYIPYAFSMAPFITLRACEQCRTDIAYGNLNARLIGVYAGVSGGISGATHWALEDCAVMGSMAGMTVLEPSSPIQAKCMMNETLSLKGPIYIRCSVEPVDEYYDSNYNYQIGKASFPIEGDDGAIVCSGVIVKYAVEASKILKEKYGISVAVVDMHTIKPIDVEAIKKIAKTRFILVAQDHNVIGGLGYYVAATIAQMNLNIKFKILGFPDKFLPMAHAPYLYNKYELDSQGLINNVLTLLSIEG